MSGEILSGLVDEVQVFHVAQALEQGNLDLATSPNSHIAVLEIPHGGRRQIPAQDSDQILVVLQGGGTVEGTVGHYALAADQGALIPTGVACTVTNTAGGELRLFSMLTKKSAAPVANVPSNVTVKIPVEHLDAKGIGHRIYAYVMDHRTIGISPLIMEEWNQASALRMNCDFETAGNEVIARLPQRIVQWYRLTDLTDDDYTVRPDRTRMRVRVDLSPFIERRVRG